MECGSAFATATAEIRLIEALPTGAFAQAGGSPSRSCAAAKAGAPGRTRTSTMFPPPDFESGASTNSATGAGGRDHSGDAGAVNADVRRTTFLPTFEVLKAV